MIVFVGHEYCSTWHKTWSLTQPLWYDEATNPVSIHPNWEGMFPKVRNYAVCPIKLGVISLEAL